MAHHHDTIINGYFVRLIPQCWKGVGRTNTYDKVFVYFNEGSTIYMRDCQKYKVRAFHYLQQLS